jgi:hydroxylamine reductase
LGINDPEINRFSCKAIFSTLTNVNFDESRLQELINQTVEHRERLKEKVAKAGGATAFNDAAATFKPAETIPELIKQGQEAGQVWNAKLVRREPDDI